MLDVAFGPVADDEHWRAGLNFYLNSLRDVDRHIDTVLDALEASGQADRTVVIFTADHGDLAGSHGLRQKGNLVYDENFHVPLIIAHPDRSGPTTTDAMASAVDLAPTLLAITGLDDQQIATDYPALKGHSLLPALTGGQVRDGVLTAVESITTLDADFWTHFDQPDVVQRIESGSLRPDWTKRGFLRGYTNRRYTFGRYFSPLEPSRPTSLDRLFTDNDVVLYDRQTDPAEEHNLASDPAQRNVVSTCLDKLETLISDEIGNDTRAWVTERPHLLGWPTWRGDRDRS
jgi:arylsulfatase